MVSNCNMKNDSFFELMQQMVTLFRERHQFRTAETYTTTMNSFRRFLEGHDIPFRSVTPELVENYETWLLKKGLSRNSTSFYMRILRAVFNHAVDLGHVPISEPFRHVYTGVDKTRKRAIPLSVIRRMKALDLESRPDLAFSRDMFLFSFFTRGMSFVDMAYLRPGSISQGCLSYVRKKTGQLLRIHWEDCMQEIVDRYPAGDAGYLLPIITDPGRDDRNQYRNVLFHVNAGLAEISRMLHLDPPITTYVARHSWATAAYSQNVPVSIISEALGHDSERTTRIYLASVSNSRVDRANSMIIKKLL